MKKLILSAVVLSVLLCTPAAFADGYLFTLKEEIAVPFSLDSDIERVPISSEIMYKADTIDEIYDFVSEDSIVDIIYNCDIELFDAPNDPYYASQWNLSDTNALYAYEKGLRGDGVKIGIIDSGINYGHEDINTDKIVRRYNVFDETEDVTDELGHGSFVSGIIGADTNNGIGVAGIADNADIAMYKIFNAKNTSLENFIVGFDRAIEDGCDVINLSLGVDTTDIATINQLQAMVNRAVGKNIIVVAAVGNNYDSRKNYPAACDNVIGVGSVNKSHTRSSFSNYNNSVFVTAPGEYLVSTWYGSSSSYAPNGGVYTGNLNYKGTSFSAPLVTAMAALAKQVNKDMTVDEFGELLIETSTDLGAEGYDTSYGYGLVNIEKFTDKLFEKYPFFINFSKDNSKIKIFNNYSEAIPMYKAGYSNGAMQSLSKETVPIGITETDLTTIADCDSVKLFFWQDMTPVWDVIDIE